MSSKQVRLRGGKIATAVCLLDACGSLRGSVGALAGISFALLFYWIPLFVVQGVVTCFMLIKITVRIDEQVKKGCLLKETSGAL